LTNRQLCWPRARAAARATAADDARRIAIANGAVVVIYRTAQRVSRSTESFAALICTGLLRRASVRAAQLYVIRDWLPFALVLVAYDSAGERPSDRTADFGRGSRRGSLDVLRHVPKVWLQERLKLPYHRGGRSPSAPSTCRFHPSVCGRRCAVATRSRGMGSVRPLLWTVLGALIIYALLPAAPPWAAARCTPGRRHRRPVGPGVHVRSHAASPTRIARAMQAPGRRHGWVERMVGRVGAS